MAQLIESINKPLRVNGSKTLSGLFAITDTFNQNRRRYPSSIYEEAYKELIPKIRERRLLGELDHPVDRDEVFLSNVSHVITECHADIGTDGKKIYSGTVELLDTPAGKIAQALVKAGIPLGISSRGVGNTKRVSEGLDVTQFKLITYDLVAEPSFNKALLTEEKVAGLSESLNSIESKLPMNESVEYDSIRNKINSIRESLRLTESEVDHKREQEIQTMEIDALKSLVESKSQVISSDTKILKASRKQHLLDSKKIKCLEEDLSKMKTRYTSIRENNQKLQEDYNHLKESYKSEMDQLREEKDAKILGLQKRLAVEKRGMSYSSVKGLLEGLTSEEEINSRLDTFTTMGRRSSTLTESYTETVKDRLLNDQKEKNPLSRIIARV